MADYLKENPDYLVVRPDLLSLLNVPHHQSGASSLVEYQVGVLRDKNRELDSRLAELVQVAGENQALMQRTYKLAMDMMVQRSMPEMLEQMAVRMRGEFSVDQVSIWLSGFPEPEMGLKQIRWLTGGKIARASFADILKCQKPVCGRFQKEKLEFLFATDADAIGSCAVIPLQEDGVLGLLALGSRDPDHFHPGMGTVFLQLIGYALDKGLARFGDGDSRRSS